ncbi:hypothetical protein G9X52_06195 [Cronobacter sakazakii]|uniref:hypothetical protein n=1 Tax=Cronobacter sakazakii TaxID=28141 RepID=UPI000BE85648|nr:hypothetical protein [Cronobacter sakazakii]NCH90364.1 hypothetical protein [Cronobacter sakazakii]NHV92979.1 hypothetical protein [Cronobacter sakazakii]PQV69959.1 hypothetical protein CDT97_02265 [Cronobacter sakazakii]PQY16191.1 hypothetical protein C5957_18120 [Cronobacter sakazakii]HAU5454623.1 hypothetical protein [Cronobacter sakazakii]
MRKIFFIMISFSASLFANDNCFNDYFLRFSSVFSSKQVSEKDYMSLVDYFPDVNIFVNYGIKPPRAYIPREGGSLVLQNPSIIFNGNNSRLYFLKYINEEIIKNQVIMRDKPVVYKSKGVTYTFHVKEANGKIIVLTEDILAPVDDEIFSEHDCLYFFSKTLEGVIKLTNINCAG